MTTKPDGADPRPASRLQNRLWFFHRLHPELPFFTVPITLELSGAVDPAGVRAVLGELLNRHDALRTCLVATPTGPRPVLIDPEVQLRTEDLRADPDPAASWNALLELASHTPLDLERGPLLRALLARVADDRYQLCLCVHHATVDGVSVEVLLREFATAYGAWERGEPAGSLGEPPAEYAEFARWHEQAATGPAYARARDYWRREFADLSGGAADAGREPLVDLAADRPHTADRSFQVRVLSKPLPLELGVRIREFARERRVTPFVVLAAALATVLRGRDGGHGDVVLATPWTLRRDKWLDGTVGMFANTIPLRVRMSGDPAFDEVVTAARSAVFGAMDNSLVPYDEIVALAAPVRVPGRPPLAAVGFQVLDAATTEFQAGSVRMRRLSTRDGAGDFDLVWDLIGAPDGSFSLAATYTADIFDEETVTGLRAELVRVIDESLADPASPVSRRAVAPAPSRATERDAGVAAVAALDAHPAVRESVVLRQPVRGRAEAIAFVAVSDTSVTPAALRARVAAHVAEDAVPAWFVLLDELPRDTDGAVDTAELTAIAGEVIGTATDGDPAVEAAVREVWEEHLGTVVPHIDATFFDLQGHSLIAVRIAAALQRRFGRPVPVRAIFEHPTVRTLAAHLAASPPPAATPGTGPAVAADETRLATDLDAASEQELHALAALIGDEMEAGA